jgi:hypothetical protein
LFSIPFTQVCEGENEFYITPMGCEGAATRAINQALAAGWRGLDIAEIAPWSKSCAHESVERPVKPGRVLVAVAA